MTNEEIKDLLAQAETEFDKGNYKDVTRIANVLLEHTSSESEAYVISILYIADVQRMLGDYEQALEYSQQAIHTAQKNEYLLHLATSNSLVGIVYLHQGLYTQALEYFHQALQIHEQENNQSGIATITANIGIVFKEQGLYELALDYFQKTLLMRQELNLPSGIASVTVSIANVYKEQGYYEKALEHYRKAQQLNEQSGKQTGIAIVAGNMGNVYTAQGLYSAALECYDQALNIYEKISDKSGISFIMGSYGELYSNLKYERYNPKLAEKYLLNALQINTEIGANSKNIAVYECLASLYQHESKWQEAFTNLLNFQKLERSINSEEIKRKTQQYDHQRKIAERERELAIEKAAADAKHAATQSLLHKVLPDVIAKRMVEGEVEIADYYECVTILFADIEGFTPMSANMPANIVVRLLNHIFSEFDHIMKKHGCEKIKTIGDGYMAIAGAPVVCDDHAERMAAAAVDMLGALELPDELLTFVPQGTRLNIRIGIHTGAVVAGVVGEDRFVYDVYSDAVNTAARMESHGESGRIHVSSDYVQHLHSRMVETNSYTFESRGVIEVKGKGRMETYFLERG